MGLKTRCPKCEADIRDGARRCPMCGTPLSIMAFEPPEQLEGEPVIDPLLVVPRSPFSAALRSRPVVDRGTRLAKGPAETPRDLIRVHVCKNPDEVRALVKEFRFMGARLWTGSDALDADPNPATVGLYVRPADYETAKYLLGAVRNRRSDDLPPRDLRDATRKVLDLALGYFEFGKYKHVIALLTPLAGDPEADDLLSESLLFAGRVREAE